VRNNHGSGVDKFTHRILLEEKRKVAGGIVDAVSMFRYLSEKIDKD
jgi:hypothetical protein